MTSGVHSCIRVPADIAVVSFVRSAFACVLEREEWPSDGAGRVLLASSEAVTNAIEHGSPAGGAVEVELSVTLDRADIRVLDQGRPGGPRAVLPLDPPPPSSPRGRGLIIISRLADDFDLRVRGGGTEVTAGFLRYPAEIEIEIEVEPVLARRAA